MLSGKQTKFLRKKANPIKPILQVGKGGINENLLKQVEDALEARELIKISILQNNADDKHEVAEEISTAARAQVVQLIGSTIILYKESQDNKQIELPE